MSTLPNTQTSLFAEPQETAIARLDSTILALIMGYSGGPLGLKIEEREKCVLRAIRYRRGQANAITIAELSQQIRLDARAIKSAIRALRINFHLPIGSSKNGTEGGYFLMITEDDRAVWAKDVLDQVRAEIAVLRAGAGQHATLELLGQLQLEVRPCA